MNKEEKALAELLLTITERLDSIEKRLDSLNGKHALSNNEVSADENNAPKFYTLHVDKGTKETDNQEVTLSRTANLIIEHFRRNPPKGNVV